MHRYKADRPKMNMVEYDSDHSDDEGDVFAAELFGHLRPNPLLAMI